MSLQGGNRIPGGEAGAGRCEREHSGERKQRQDGQAVCIHDRHPNRSSLDSGGLSLVPHLVDGKLSEAAERGKELFSSERVGCHRCHPAPLFTDLKSHNVGTRNASDRGDIFDSPTLIEAWRTAPYLHGGRYTSIRELLVEGRHGLRGSRHRDLTDQELADLVEFVLSL